MSNAARTWHFGLVARWWAEFNQGGEDIDFFRTAIERSGEPVLDAGCGTGRLLLPFLREGIDADGSDASSDMLDWCRKAAEEERLTVALYPQAMHELTLPRRYRTIVVCGAFGLGGTREQDLEGLRRLRRHLEPGGQLLLDHHLPNFGSRKTWSYWIEQPELPRPWPAQGDRRTARDGTELELHSRMVALNPLEQTTTLEIRATQHEGDTVLASETNQIDINLYFRGEIELMLGAAGYCEIEVQTIPDGRSPRPWEDERIVFRARG